MREPIPTTESVLRTDKIRARSEEPLGLFVTSVKIVKFLRTKIQFR